MAFSAQAELGLVAPDHGPAPLPAHHLSPLAKKFRFTANSPILACRSRISPSWSPRARSAPFVKTFIPSTARGFQVLTWFGWTLCRAAIWLVLFPRSAFGATFVSRPSLKPSCHSTALTLRHATANGNGSAPPSARIGPEMWRTTARARTQRLRAVHRVAPSRRALRRGQGRRQALWRARLGIQAPLRGVRCNRLLGAAHASLLFRLLSVVVIPERLGQKLIVGLNPDD